MADGQVPQEKQTLHDGQFLTVRYVPSLTYALDLTNVGLPQHVGYVSIEYKLNPLFREYLSDRDKADDLPAPVVAAAVQLGLKYWDSTGYAVAPGTLPSAETIQAFESGFLELERAFESTGIPAAAEKRQRDAAEAERKRGLKVHEKLCKLVPKAASKAAQANDMRYYGTFCKALGKYGGAREHVGILLAQLDAQIVDVPLEVGRARAAARAFHAEHQRWPRYPMALGRTEDVITEI
jgi:hypothetical protein